MESLSPQVVFAAKLPILNPNEFDLWKIRIEQYFLMTDYSLWELILNIDSHIPTRVVDGVFQPVAPTTVVQRLAKKNELKAQRTLLMDLPDKHQLKFNIYKDAKSLMETIKKRFGGNKETKKEWRTHTLIWRNKTDLEDQSLDDLFNNLKIYEAEVKSSSSTSPTTQNIAFMSSQNTNSTNESVSAVTSVFAASTKVPVSSLPNMDSLSDVMPMLTMRARRFLHKIGRNLGANGTTSIGFDMSKVECYNCHMRGHFAREYSYDWSFQADEEPTNYALMAFTSSSSSSSNNEVVPCLESVEARLVVFQQNENVFEEDIKLLKFDVMLRDNALVELRKEFEKAEQDRDDSESDVSIPPSPLHDSSIKPNKDLSQSVSPLSISLKIGLLTQKMNLRGNPQHALKDKGVIDSVCSRHMIGNISYLSDFEEINRGYVAFGGNPKGGKIIGKDIECIVLSSDFKLPDENHVLLRVPKENNIYNVDLKNIVPSGDLTCLFAKDTLDESNLWHRRLGHINFKTMNKLVKGNLVRGLPSKVFENNHTCVAPAEAVNTACYVQNRVLVTKPHNKTPYELLLGRIPSIGFMRPFGCPVTILNTLDPLGKFDRKADEGFLVGYSMSSKAFRVFNSRTRLVQETLHINFLENQPNVARSRPTWLFDIDTLTQSMNYQSVVAGNQPNSSAGIQENLNAGTVRKEANSVQQYVLLPLWSSGSKDPQNTDTAAFEVKEPESAVHVSPSSCDKTKKHDDKTKREAKEKIIAVRPNSTNNTNTFSAAVPSNTAVSLNFELGRKSSLVDPSQYPNDLNMPASEDITYSDDEEDVGADADFSNLETNITVSPIPTTRVHKDHLVTQIIGDLSLAPKIRSMTRMVKEHGGLTQINDDDFHTCMFSCFISQEEPKRGHTQEEGIDYEEVFAPVARIEAIRLFLAYASFVGFMVYQMDVKSAFLYGTIKEEVYVRQPLGFEDPDYPDKVYKVVKVLYGLHQAPRAWYETLANYLLENGFQKGKIDQTLFIKKQKGDILLVRVYVDDIIFGSTNKDLHIFNVVRLKLLLFGLTVDAAHLLLLEDVAEDEDDVNEVFDEPTPPTPSPTPATSPPPPQPEHITSPPQAETTQPSPPPQPQPSQTTEISMTLLNQLLETYATLTKQVANLEQDKVEQEIEITKLKQRVKMQMRMSLWRKLLLKKQRMLMFRGEEVIEVVTAAKLMIEVVTTTTTTNTAAPMPKASALRKRRGMIIQDPEEAATTSEIMQLKVKSKDKGKGILVEEAKPLKRQAQIKQDEAFARELEAELNANINWNDVIDQVKRKERQDITVMRYQALKRKPITEAQERKNMMVYLKNMDGFKMDFFKEPENFSNNFLLNTLKTMFEKPNVEASTWRNQRGRYELVKVKSWKLLESCGVHIITFTTTQMILLVERKYPLTRFTLEQMLNNVRLEVEKESDMSLELLRLKSLDDALVAPADRLEFGKCNMRLKTDIKPKEATFQVVLDALALTPFYRAFLITANVPSIYMHEFWATVLVHKSSIRFKINKKKVSLDVDMFIEILKICPKITGQEFEDLSPEQDILSFINDLGHTGDITYLTNVNVNHLHQPWRAFATIINKCLSGKETGMDKIRLSRAQIL
uniref:Putative ribonuclease H-like domain-containing protein n=1 Tax=Tanacetum cinerariifolium TaxID=118510 RepID=A0A6L2JJ64_TANCI|nr:putative ribonuclease H-like domain-containing protein [Tanacetum cinerariifolium]